MANLEGCKQCRLCPFYDKKKSLLHLGNDGRVINPKNKTFCLAVNDWVDELTPCEGSKVVKTVDYVLKCSKCGKELGYFSVPEGEKGSEIGLMNFRYTSYLFAYRNRKDGLIGFECSCGNADTRLGDIEKLENPKSFPVFVKSSSFEKAKFNDKGSYFLAIKKQ